MSDRQAPDILVIGAGAAGLTVAAAARALGLSVVLVERGRMGGECLNSGCVPSKALIAAARHAEAVRRAGRFGIEAAPPRIDPAKVFAHVHGAIAAIAPHDSEARFRGLGATVLRASARFTGPDTVEAGGATFRPKRVVIATGSRPAVPDVPGLAETPHLTNESLFDLAALPGRLAVLGAGPAGLELAQAFRRLGTAVTVIEPGRALAHDDPEAAAVVLARLAAEGVDLRQGVEAAKVETAAGGGVAVSLSDGRTVAADRLLVAAGRRPAIEDLDLAAAGIAADARGIVTDAALRTANRRVYAIGDCARSFRFTHWASYQGGLVLRSILMGWPHREDPAAVTWATFTDPELAHVGLGEGEARARFGDRVAVHRAALAANDRAVAEGETEGFVKLIAGPRGRLLGAELVGSGAGELAGTVALAVAGRLSLSTLAGAVLPYPTLGEALKRAATAAEAGRLDGRLARGLLRLARWRL